jgi:hypothetical protein
MVMLCLSHDGDEWLQIVVGGDVGGDNNGG